MGDLLREARSSNDGPTLEAAAVLSEAIMASSVHFQRCGVDALTSQSLL